MSAALAACSSPAPEADGAASSAPTSTSAPEDTASPSPDTSQSPDETKPDEGSETPTSEPEPTSPDRPSSEPSTEKPSEPSLRTDRCTSDHLDLSLADGDGAAAGSRHPYLVVTNTGSKGCTLQGWPGVSFVGNGDGSQIGAAADLDRSSTHATVTLDAGGSAHAPLEVTVAENYPADSCDPTTPDGIRVYPPGEKHSLYVETSDYTACASSKVVLMSVQAFQPGA